MFPPVKTAADEVCVYKYNTYLFFDHLSMIFKPCQNKFFEFTLHCRKQTKIEEAVVCDFRSRILLSPDVDCSDFRSNVLIKKL